LIARNQECSQRSAIRTSSDRLFAPIFAITLAR
jgi:hypothetical protein